jgi:hypothetical protein
MKITINKGINNDDTEETSFEIGSDEESRKLTVKNIYYSICWIVFWFGFFFINCDKWLPIMIFVAICNSLLIGKLLDKKFATK